MGGVSKRNKKKAPVYPLAESLPSRSRRARRHVQPVFHLLKDGDTRPCLRVYYDIHRTIARLAVHWKGDIAVTGDRKGWMRAWDLRSGCRLWVKKAHADVPDRAYSSTIGALGISADGKYVYSSGAEPNQGALLRVWELVTGRYVKSLARDSENGILAVYERIVLMSDGCHALLSDGYSLSKWDLTANRRVWLIKGTEPADLISATGGGERILVLKRPVLTLLGPDGRDRRMLMALEDDPLAPPGHLPTASAFAEPNGRLLVTAGYQGDLAVWDAVAGQLVSHWKAVSPSAPIATVAIAPDGKRALTGGEMEQLQLWDLATGKILHHFPRAP